MDIKDVFTDDDLKLVKKALEVYRKCNWPDEESKVLIDKVERLCKYTKTGVRMEQIGLELK